MVQTSFIYILVAAVFSIFRVASAGEISLSSVHLTVTISDATGQITNICDAQKTTILAGNEDRYDMAGKRSGETDDRVLDKKVNASSADFKCENRALGLTITKRYELVDNSLKKEMSFTAAGSEKRLLQVSSKSLIEPTLFKDGYYYLPTDDGYKMTVLPFRSGPSVTEPTGWPVSTGSFIYYFPKQDRVWTHYRNKVNGQDIYAQEALEVESKFIPGGAITALGMDFIGDGKMLSLESRYVLLNGDPSDYHRYRLNQPPCSDYKKHRVPNWFKKTRMFMSDPGAGLKGLMEDQDAVIKDIAGFMKFLKDDEYLLLFFNHWTVQGNFPYEGTFRYYTYTDAGYSKPVPIAKLKEAFARINAISPRIKIGGYALFIPSKGTPPYDDHKDWMVYDKDGKITFAGDGTVTGGFPDFSSGYRDYLLNQMTHYLSDLGFDWIHIDYGPLEGINWKTKAVVQSYECGKFYNKLRQIFEAKDAAIVQNMGWLAALWADGTYVECYQPDRWEKKDWRILAIPGSLGEMYRTQRPGAWINWCFGSYGIFGIRNAQTGMKGWIRGSLSGWRDIAHCLAYEKINDELLETRLADARVYPSWWKLQTDKLEVEALRRGEALLIPALLHGEQGGTQEISISTAELKNPKGHLLFSFDMLLYPPTALDAFKPVPFVQDYLQLIRFNVATDSGGKHVHHMKMEPMRNYYHLITAVPGWVYTVDGDRSSFLLPESKGVKISGTAASEATSYLLTIENANRAAQVLAYLPATWKGVKVQVNGKPVPAARMNVLGNSCLLVDIAKGKSAVEIAESAKDTVGLGQVQYTNPREQTGRETAQRVVSENIECRAYEEDGKSCLELKQLKPGSSSLTFPMVTKEEAGGFSIKVKGQNRGTVLTVTLAAGDSWKYGITDNFTGWKRFDIYHENMTPNTTVKKWDVTTTLWLGMNSNQAIDVADLHLLPARPGDLPVKGGLPPKRSLAIYHVKTPPVIDGFGNEPAWSQCEVTSDFIKYDTGTPSASKTEVRVCYDENNLYVLFNNFEPIVELNRSKIMESQVWLSDHVHLFIDPYRDMVHYFEIGVDTGGSVADIKNTGSGMDMKWNGVYEVKTGLNYNVSWMMEMRIPFTTLGKKPKDGDVWGITFARVDNTKEFSLWTAGPWNDPNAFGLLTFGGEKK